MFADALMLFAQRRVGGAAPPPAADPGDAAAAGGVLIGMLACYGLVIVAAIVVQIMFLLAMSRALKACKPRNREFEPGQVWFVLIPLVGIYFWVMMVLKVPESIANEYEDRGWRPDGDFGKNIGLWYLITSFVCGPVGLVLWIMFWLKISKYSKELASRKGGGSRSRDEDDDEEDERPRRPKSRRRVDKDEDE